MILAFFLKKTNVRYNNNNNNKISVIIFGIGRRTNTLEKEEVFLIVKELLALYPCGVIA